MFVRLVAQQGDKIEVGGAFGVAPPAWEGGEGGDAQGAKYLKRGDDQGGVRRRRPGRVVAIVCLRYPWVLPLRR